MLIPSFPRPFHILMLHMKGSCAHELGWLVGCGAVAQLSPPEENVRCESRKLNREEVCFLTQRHPDERETEYARTCVLATVITVCVCEFSCADTSPPLEETIGT